MLRPDEWRSMSRANRPTSSATQPVELNLWVIEIPKAGVIGEVFSFGLWFTAPEPNYNLNLIDNDHGAFLAFAIAAG